MLWIKNLARISPTASSVGNLYRNSESSYTLSSRFCTALQRSETVQPTEVVNGSEQQQQHRYHGLAPTKEGGEAESAGSRVGLGGLPSNERDRHEYLRRRLRLSEEPHGLFTPLLASTCVGTLEFRSVAEPISRIQPAISREPGSLLLPR
ncbi:Internal alternative NAD(P)H-ubiquinone oxidoreductase A1 [Raphanus sativus]|nr:Internal alternative NAD(P)H-ubiquinone oxidoreductase A1 [Raphanus sativus]